VRHRRGRVFVLSTRGPTRQRGVEAAGSQRGAWALGAGGPCSAALVEVVRKGGLQTGVGASAKVHWRKSGGYVTYKGRIWDRKGDGWHARIYGYSLGHPFPIRKATRGRSRTFSGKVPAPAFFEVCTYDRSTEVACTRKWTHN